MSNAMYFKFCNKLADPANFVLPKIDLITLYIYCNKLPKAVVYIKITNLL